MASANHFVFDRRLGYWGAEEVIGFDFRSDLFAQFHWLVRSFDRNLELRFFIFLDTKRAAAVIEDKAFVAMIDPDLKAIDAQRCVCSKRDLVGEAPIFVGGLLL